MVLLINSVTCKLILPLFTFLSCLFTKTCFLRLGAGWEVPIHKEVMVESLQLEPKTEKPKQNIDDSAEEKVNETGHQSNSENEKVANESSEKIEASSSNSDQQQNDPKLPSNEELAKMWEPKTRQSIAQRLKGEYSFPIPQCGNFLIFLPLRVYVKSILVIHIGFLKPPKMPF